MINSEANEALHKVKKFCGERMQDTYGMNTIYDQSVGMCSGRWALQSVIDYCNVLLEITDAE